MGVKISDIISKKQLSWEDLNNKVLAIDSSNMLFQFLSSIRQPDGTPLQDSNGKVTSHIVGLASRIPNLIDKGIKPIFVFDGLSPKLKKKEQERRSSLKEIAEEKFEEAEEVGDTESMLKYAKMSTRMTSEMVRESKELLSAMGLPVIQAPSEAEAQCSLLCRKKEVWAVASQDYDCLLYGAPRIVQSLTLSQKRRLSSGKTITVTPELIELKEVMQQLELNQDQLIFLGILVGTDFNIGGIKGIGQKKALALVQSGKSFEAIFEDLKPNFDWKEIFDLFKNMPVTEDYNVKFKAADLDSVKSILESHDFSQERINSTLEKLKPKAKPQTSLDSWIKK